MVVHNVPKKLHARRNWRARTNRKRIYAQEHIFTANITYCHALKGAVGQEAFLHSSPVSDGNALLSHRVQQRGYAVKGLGHVHDGQGRGGSLQTCYQLLDIADAVGEKHHSCDYGPHVLRLVQGTTRKTEQKALNLWKQVNPASNSKKTTTYAMNS